MAHEIYLSGGRLWTPSAMELGSGTPRKVLKHIMAIFIFRAVEYDDQPPTVHEIATSMGVEDESVRKMLREVFKRLPGLLEYTDGHNWANRGIRIAAPSDIDVFSFHQVLCDAQAQSDVLAASDMLAEGSALVAQSNSIFASAKPTAERMRGPRLSEEYLKGERMFSSIPLSLQRDHLLFEYLTGGWGDLRRLIRSWEQARGAFPEQVDWQKSAWDLLALMEDRPALSSGARNSRGTIRTRLTIDGEAKLLSLDDWVTHHFAPRLNAYRSYKLNAYNPGVISKRVRLYPLNLQMLELTGALAREQAVEIAAIVTSLGSTQGRMVKELKEWAIDSDHRLRGRLYALGALHYMSPDGPEHAHSLEFSEGDDAADELRQMLGLARSDAQNRTGHELRIPERYWEEIKKAMHENLTLRLRQPSRVRELGVER